MAKTTPPDFWCLDHGTVAGGHLVRPGAWPAELTLSGSATLARLRTQNIPASAPAGQYLYEGRIGAYPGTVWDNSSFNFTKSAAGDGTPIGNWDNSGESFDFWMANTAPAPASFALLGAFPNPFNPTTTIKFNLPTAAQVKLEIYDSERPPGGLDGDGWRDAGSQEITFDGSGLASGIYFYALHAGSDLAQGKLALIK